MDLCKCVLTLILLAIILTQQDVEVSWDGANWSSPEILSISYSSEPLRPEKKIGKTGIQEWESLMCDSTTANPRKAIIQVNIPTLPSPQDRTLYLRVRNRFDDDSEVGPWSDPGTVKITGKPKNVQ